MNSSTVQLLKDQRTHLAGLIEAIQRCTYFLNASASTVVWPLSGAYLYEHKKTNELFEALAAVNERFAKLQDTLGSAMRHSLNLSGEQADSRSEEHTSELQSHHDLVCRLLLEQKKN